MNSLLKLLLIVLLCPFVAAADENPVDASAAPILESSPIWWRQSSFQTLPLSSRLLLHAEATLSAEWKTGNNKGNEQSGDVMTALRWKRLTNYILFEIDNQTYKIIPNNQFVEQRRYAIEEILRLDLNRYFFVDGDVLYNKNTSLLLSRRLAWYGGAGVYLQKGPADISFFLGAGYDNKKYDSNVSFADAKGEAIFFSETFDYALGSKTELRQLSRFIKPINGAGFSEYNIKAVVAHTIARGVAVTIMFEYIHNKVDIPNVLADDTNQGIGLQLMW